MRIQQSMGKMLSSNMLLPNLIPLIDVTFSTPTGYYVNDAPYSAGIQVLSGLYSDMAAATFAVSGPRSF